MPSPIPTTGQLSSTGVPRFLLLLPPPVSFCVFFKEMVLKWCSELLLFLWELLIGKVGAGCLVGVHVSTSAAQLWIVSATKAVLLTQDLLE